MIEVLLTVVPAMIWLMYRLYYISKTPLDKLLEDSNIEIPNSPTICIDSIAKDSIVLHWDIEIKLNESLYYIILINGQEAATLTSKSCKLNNLTSKCLYKTEIIAVNSMTNYKTKSKPVSVKTYGDDTFESELNLEDLEEENVMEKKENNVVHDLDLESITLEQITQIQDSRLLNDYLAKSQNELVKTNTELKTFQTNISFENSNLQKELQFYKTELEEETDNKNKKDNDVKSLERSKDRLVFQKSKLSNQLNLIKNSLTIFNSKFKENEIKIRKLSERNKHALNNEENENYKINQKIKQLEEKLETKKSENEKLDEHIKSIAIEKKEMFTSLNQIKPLIEQFNQISDDRPSPSSSTTSLSPPPMPTFNKDGSLTKASFDSLVKIFQIMPAWQDEIMHEINNYQEFEQQWKDAFKREIQKYVTMHQSIEMMKFQNDSNYQPIRLNEYQASIEFGGFANALPKPKYPSKRNFSPATDEKQNFYNHYSQVYSEKNESREGSPQNQPLQTMTNTTSNQNQPLLSNDYLSTQYSQPQHHPYISLEQINAATTQVASSNVSLTPTLNHNLLNSHEKSSSNGNLTTPGFPYDDQIYRTSMGSPLQSNNLLYNGNNNSFLNGYNNQTPLTSNNLNEVWNSSMMNNSNQELSNTKPSFLMTPTQSSNIWMDEKVNGHTRSVSNNSLWRNEYPSTILQNNSSTTHNNIDFQPFANLQSIHGNDAYYNTQKQYQQQNGNESEKYA